MSSRVFVSSTKTQAGYKAKPRSSQVRSSNSGQPQVDSQSPGAIVPDPNTLHQQNKTGHNGEVDQIQAPAQVGRVEHIECAMC